MIGVSLLLFSIAFMITVVMVTVIIMVVMIMMVVVMTVIYQSLGDTIIEMIMYLLSCYNGNTDDTDVGQLHVHRLLLRSEIRQ